MNQLIVKVVSIEHKETLHLLKLSQGKETINMLTLELNSMVNIGTELTISIKSTHIGISRYYQKDISIENQIKAKIIH